jgi:acetamidase/formamidase
MAPVLHVASGDRVTIDSVSGGPDALPPAGFHVPPELFDIHARSVRHLPGHILTGPVHVEGAEPGDMLEVRIVDVRLRQDWGYNVIRPLAGTLPADFDDTSRLINIPLDADRMVGRMPWGLDLPLHPFFGVMGVAPPARWGRITSIVPRAHGGNLDNKELGPGASLFLPVHVPGALFSCGDGHAAQGDGEVCTTAIETALVGDFELIVHKHVALAYPRGETPTHLITMGMDPDLDQCMAMALRDMIVLLGERAGMARADAYTLCSVAVDFRITQTVNGHRGVHAMVAKKLLG